MPILGGGGVLYVAAASGSSPASYVGRASSTTFLAGAGSRTLTVAGLDAVTGLAVCVANLHGSANPTLASATINGVAATVRQTAEYARTASYLIEADVSAGDASGEVILTIGANAANEQSVVAFDCDSLTYQSGATAGGTNALNQTVFDLSTSAGAGDSIVAGGITSTTATATITGATEQLDETVGSRSHFGALNTSATGSDTVQVTLSANFIWRAMVAGVYA